MNMKKVDISIKAKAQPAETAALLIRLLDTLIADCRYVVFKYCKPSIIRRLNFYYMVRGRLNIAET